jgi:dUTP pyrophosphatase
MLVLYVVPANPDVKALYESVAAAYMAKPKAEKDAGFDLVSPATSAEAGVVAKISQQCSAAVYDTERGCFRAYWMLPRSSLSKTPLRLANSVGLIDAGYRGTLLAAVDVMARHVVEANTRLFQIAAPDLLPFDKIWIVDEIPGGPTARGAGGFGSTGITTTATAAVGTTATAAVATTVAAAVATVAAPSHGYFSAPE